LMGQSSDCLCGISRFNDPVRHAPRKSAQHPPRKLQRPASATSTTLIIDGTRRHNSGSVSSMDERSCRRRNPNRNGRRMSPTTATR
jgi:hypothetical protein